MMEKTPDSVMRFRKRGERTWMPEKARGWESDLAPGRMLAGWSWDGEKESQAGVPTLLEANGEWRVASGEFEEKADSSLRSE